MTGVQTCALPIYVPTIGHGTTRYEDGSAVKMGDRVTPERAQVLLRNDASTYERAVKRCAPVPMHQHEFDAFVSLAYNVGAGAPGVKDGFCVLKSGRPSSIVRHLLAGEYEQACRGLLAWDKFRGRTLPGLVARREREARQCLGEPT